MITQDELEMFIDELICDKHDRDVTAIGDDNDDN